MYTTKPSIKMWAEDDRPREKMLLKGYKSLSDSELLAILINTGSRSKSAIELAQELLRHSSNNLSEFAKCSIQDFQKVKGIGEAKAVTIAAALELGRRRKEATQTEKPKIESAKSVYALLKPYFEDISIEMFYVIFLNRSNLVIGIECLSQGGMSSTIVDGKLVFKKALNAGASAIILGHNHPSGNRTPSSQDIATTSRLRDFGKMIDLPVLDHLIYTENGYYSFAEHGDL